MPGKRAQVDLPVADLSTRVPIAMPVHVINGRREGPRLFVSAALHGDEINGVEIIRRVTQCFAKAASASAAATHGKTTSNALVSVYESIYRAACE